MTEAAGELTGAELGKDDFRHIKGYIGEVIGHAQRWETSQAQVDTLTEVVDKTTELLSQTTQEAKRAEQETERAQQQATYAFVERVSRANNTVDSQLMLVNLWLSFKEKRAPSENSQWIRHLNGGHQADYATFEALAEPNPVLVIQPPILLHSGLISAGTVIFTNRPPIITKNHGELAVDIIDDSLKDDIKAASLTGLRPDYFDFDLDGLHQSIVVGKDAIKDYINDIFEPSVSLNVNLRYRKAIVELALTEDCEGAFQRIDKAIRKYFTTNLGLRKNGEFDSYEYRSGYSKSILACELRLLAASPELGDISEQVMAKITKSVSEGAPHADYLVDLVARSRKSGKDIEKKIPIEELATVKAELLSQGEVD